MFGLNYLQLAWMAAVPVAFLLVTYRGPILSALGSLWQIAGKSEQSPPTKSEKPKPTRMATLGHLDEAYEFFREANCQEGMDAIKLAAQHVFEHKGAA